MKCVDRKRYSGNGGDSSGLGKGMVDRMNRSRLLIYAHYYVPDQASTGQILQELAEGLSDTFDVTVICVVPSYLGIIEEQYKEKRFYEEYLNGVKVLRIRVPEFTKANKWSRVKNILAYFLGAMMATFQVGKQDYIFSISQPPILGGLLGVWGKWMKRGKFLYNIQDFNPEQIMAVGYSKNQMVLKLMMILDKFSCLQSNLVITVGRDLVETMKKRFSGKKVPHTVMINNWMNESELYPLPRDHEKVLEFRKQYGLEDKFIMMYSGNIGLYYDLENILKVMETFKPGTKTREGKEVIFVFVGGGSILNKLMLYKEKQELHNVLFLPYQEKSNLIYSLNAGDVHLVVNAKGIKGVSCPSKCYGVMAVGKPILAVLEPGSECRLLLETIGHGACCEPEDYEGIKNQIEHYIQVGITEEMEASGMKCRRYLEEHLTKDISLHKYRKEIQGLESAKRWIAIGLNQH